MRLVSKSEFIKLGGMTKQNLWNHIKDGSVEPFDKRMIDLDNPKNLAFLMYRYSKLCKEGKTPNFTVQFSINTL